MRVLLTNDDGIQSHGLQALEAALAPLCELWVVAPDREQSAASHAISLSRPLRMYKAGERRFAVDGTPTDCVYLALNHLLRSDPPQAVFSGINHGPNLAEDILYSGTVAGAMEGYILGVPFNVAMSAIPEGHRFDFAPAAELARRLLASSTEAIAGGPVLLNVNVPPGPLGGHRLTALGRRGYLSQVEERRDPRGRPYYWIGGPERDHEDLPGSDCNAVFDERLASITPLQVDLTDPRSLQRLASWEISAEVGAPRG